MTERLAADPAGVARAAALLRAGELVGFGTETVYGLGADATDGRAVAGIFAVKGRPAFNPLICHYPDAATALRGVRADDHARALAAAFWPGPLTLVLPRMPDCPVDPLAAAGLATLGVRVPGHGVARALLAAVGRPVAAPSANRSGGVSPSTAAHVLADLEGRIAAVLDCGPCLVGVESTVLDLSGALPALLRPGAVTAAAIEAVVGRLGTGQGPIRSPGMLASHYAPSLPLRLGHDPGPNEAWLMFGTAATRGRLYWNMSEAGDLTEAASRLFSGLRWLDAEGQRQGLRGIVAGLVPEEGLGVAINDRLRRAAA